MSDLQDQEYYATRAQTSRDLAGRAADPTIAAIHAEFATRYEFLAGSGDPVGTNSAGAQAA